MEWAFITVFYAAVGAFVAAFLRSYLFKQIAEKRISYGQYDCWADALPFFAGLLWPIAIFMFPSYLFGMKLAKK